MYMGPPGKVKSTEWWWRFCSIHQAIQYHLENAPHIPIYPSTLHFSHNNWLFEVVVGWVTRSVVFVLPPRAFTIPALIAAAFSVVLPENIPLCQHTHTSLLSTSRVRLYFSPHTHSILYKEFS